MVKSQRGALDKFVIRKTVDVEERVQEPIEATTLDVEENLPVPTEEDDDVPQEENVEIHEESVVGSDLNDNGDDINVNIYDPRNWDTLEPKWKDLLVRNGPKRDMLIGKDPTDGSKRRFSSDFYTRWLQNGEKHHRNWLVYSLELNRVFCFCCKLFKNKKQQSQLAYDGINNWGHLGDNLKTHERSACHISHMCIWVDLQARLENNQVIEKVVQDHLNKETEHWRNILQRLFRFMQYLATQSLAFRGSNETMDEENNGIFLDLVKMDVKWDPPLKEHLRRKRNKEIHYHYLSHKIQNEMIHLLASEIKCAILKTIKEAKYFSVILDCTPDVSKVEQMTLILRCVDVSIVSVNVEEYFLQFMIVNATTGQELFEALEHMLHHLGLDIDNLRGHSYDNGSNMKGKHKSVQRKLLDINPKAFYTPCGSHSLNLTLSYIAQSCKKAEEFFGIVQRIYKLFAESSKRWAVLKDNLPEKGFTLKSFSITRWESRVESVKTIVTQNSKIKEALLEVAKYDNDAGAKSEATYLATHTLDNFEFILGMVIWYELLVKINIVSKELQCEDMRIDVAMDSLKALITFFQNYREVGFKDDLNCAKGIAAEMGIDPMFPQRENLVEKKHFDEIATESLSQSMKKQLLNPSEFSILYT